MRFFRPFFYSISDGLTLNGTWIRYGTIPYGIIGRHHPITHCRSVSCEHLTILSPTAIRRSVTGGLAVGNNEEKHILSIIFDKIMK